MQEAWARSDFGTKFVNTMIVSTGCHRKLTLACITAFSIVFFSYRGRMVIFWLIFITLMLPLEVRIVPTYAVAANALQPFQTIMDVTGLSWLIATLTGVEVALNWNLLNSYTGLILPLFATATGSSSIASSFSPSPMNWSRLRAWTVPVPSASPRHPRAPVCHQHGRARHDHVRLCVEPVSLAAPRHHRPGELRHGRGRTLGPCPRRADNGGGTPTWHLAMAGTLIVMVPPILVVVLMQRWFVRGLINTDK